jgi:Aspartyl/asparaginyl-tRNA synthetases
MKLKPFYIREKDDDATLSRSFDLQYGFLELSSGGTRLHNPEMLKARLKDKDWILNNLQTTSKHLIGECHHIQDGEWDWRDY